MTQASDPTRLDRLEALAETTLLAVRELSNRQDRTQSQLNDTQSQLDQLKQRIDDMAQQQEANMHQIALNSEQIALHTAGMVELRNLIADFVRSQQQ